MSMSINTLVFLSLVPYISLIEFPMDTAPYAVIFLIAIALPNLYFSKKVSALRGLDIFILTMLFIFVFVLLIRLLIYKDLDSFRVLGNYGSFFFFFAYFSALSRSDKNCWELFFLSLSRLIFIVSIIYLAGSLLQLLSRVSGLDFFSEITKSLLSRSGRTSFNRGFNSFAAEPSYAGIICSLLGCITLYLYRVGYISLYRCKIAFSSFAIVVVLSASATAIPFLIALVIYSTIIFDLKDRFILGLMFTITAAAIYYMLQNMSELRFLNLISSTLSTGGSSVLEDESALSRFGSIINYSLPLFSADGFLGNALSNIDSRYLIRIIDDSGVSRELSSALEIGVTAEGGGLRTKSTISQSIFLFGIFSIIFWAMLAMRLANIKKRIPTSFPISLVIFIGYLIQIPFGHPTYCLAIGVIIISRRLNCESVKSPSESYQFSAQRSTRFS